MKTSKIYWKLEHLFRINLRCVSLFLKKKKNLKCVRVKYCCVSKFNSKSFFNEFEFKFLVSKSWKISTLENTRKLLNVLLKYEKNQLSWQWPTSKIYWKFVHLFRMNLKCFRVKYFLVNKSELKHTFWCILYKFLVFGN